MCFRNFLNQKFILLMLEVSKWHRSVLLVVFYSGPSSVNIQFSGFQTKMVFKQSSKYLKNEKINFIKVILKIKIECLFYHNLYILFNLILYSKSHFDSNKCKKRSNRKKHAIYYFISYYIRRAILIQKKKKWSKWKKKCQTRLNKNYPSLRLSFDK